MCAQHFVGYQVLHTEPAHQATSIQGRIELLAVTADDTTFVRWTTDFSNDADAAVIQDQKYKKLEVGQGDEEGGRYRRQDSSMCRTEMLVAKAGQRCWL